MKIFKYIAFSFLIIFLLLLVLGAYFYKRTIMASNALSDPIIIKIENNTSKKEAAKMLKEAGAINNEYAFLITIILYGKKINAGFYEITPSMSTVEVIRKIDAKDVKLMRVTFPEGWRMEQMAERLEKEGIMSYQDFLMAAEGKEGKLFPDTYLFNPKMIGEEVVKMMSDDFETRTKDLDLSDDQLVLASIVEREAASDGDRGLIAGIYNNRMKIGMKLQSDPTVEFGRDTNAIANLSLEEKKNYSYWKSAKTAEYTSVKSIHNTYLINGLPAGPICNPGLKSIEAAVNPSSSKYYYFFYGRDGIIYPSATRAEHEALAAKYLW